MSLYGSCPVCAYPVTSDERRCPCCEWQLESDYTLGRLTPAIQQQYEEELQRAHQRWRRSQRQHAAERTLAAAQARLRHVQQACIHARQVITPTPARRPTTALTDNVDLSTSMVSSTENSPANQPPAPRQSHYWFKRLWWSLFQPERLAEYHRQQEGR